MSSGMAALIPDRRLFQLAGILHLACLFVTKITGAKSAISFANWCAGSIRGLYLLPLMMIFRRATNDRRLIWLAVWTFYIANWIGQDYLSPQAFMLLPVPGHHRDPGQLVLEVHPITASRDSGLATRFALPTDHLIRALRWIAPADIPGSCASERWQRIAFSVGHHRPVYPSLPFRHQLTPFAVPGTALLVLFYRCT